MRKLLVLALVVGLLAAPALAVTYPVPSATVAVGTTLTLLDAATTGTSTVVTTKYKVMTQVIELHWNGTCSGGAVIIETAPSATFADTWVPLTTVSAHSDITDIIVLTFPTQSVRARVSSNVTGGGNLTVYYTGVNY